MASETGTILDDAVPIAHEYLHDVTSLRARFEAHDPLSDFIYLDNFLSADLAELIHREMVNANDFDLFGLYKTPDSEENKYGFLEFDPALSYGMLQHRTRTIPEALLPIERTLSGPSFREFLKTITGVKLTHTGLAGSAITLMEAGAFIALHSDSANKTDEHLVLTLTFTKNWRKEYGGITTYQWANQRKQVVLTPAFNSAVLFRPYYGSEHWVRQVASDAPSRTRFTWTFTFA